MVTYLLLPLSQGAVQKLVNVFVDTVPTQLSWGQVLRTSYPSNTLHVMYIQTKLR